MPAMKLYTWEEIALCTYAALFDSGDFGGIAAIERYCGRSHHSVRAKILNIVSMLDERGIPRANNLPPLSGRPNGQDGRRTNWDWVEPLVTQARSALLKQCHEILGKGPHVRAFPRES
jgi:hypothetical protein